MFAKSEQNTRRIWELSLEDVPVNSPKLANYVYIIRDNAILHPTKMISFHIKITCSQLNHISACKHAYIQQHVNLLPNKSTYYNFNLCHIIFLCAGLFFISREWNRHICISLLSLLSATSQIEVIFKSFWNTRHQWWWIKWFWDDMLKRRQKQ